MKRHLNTLLEGESYNVPLCYLFFLNFTRFEFQKFAFSLTPFPSQSSSPSFLSPMHSFPFFFATPYSQYLLKFLSNHFLLLPIDSTWTFCGDAPTLLPMLHSMDHPTSNNLRQTSASMPKPWTSLPDNWKVTNKLQKLEICNKNRRCQIFPTGQAVSVDRGTKVVYEVDVSSMRRHWAETLSLFLSAEIFPELLSISALSAYFSKLILATLSAQDRFHWANQLKNQSQ